MGIKRTLKGQPVRYSKRIIQEAKEIGLYPYFLPVSGEQGHIVRIAGKETVMLGSNNYMGMTEHPDVKRAAIEAIEKYGVGCTGSRYLNGTLDIHLEMEEKLADFMGTESALMFSTGYQTNVGTISSLASSEDYVLSDQFNHASIVDGVRLARTNAVVYKHNDMGDLRKCLSEIPKEAGVLEVTDGIFSMEGTIAKLPEIVGICAPEDVMVMVDDAHSIGVLGPHGEGTAAHFGLKVDITMGTFSKSFASMGGFIAGNEDLLMNIKHSSRTLIFSAAPPPSNVATAMKAMEIIRDEPERRRTLWRNADYLKKGLKQLGFDIGHTDSPIIPVIIGEEPYTVGWWRQLLDRGVYTNPVIYPATPRDRCLLRNSLMATHTLEDLDLVLNAYEEVLKEMPIDE
ncbi:MAG: aminotransferase class I/II-fold pyridoxal phosphate-dependent enzyme [Candidatus Thermoplasmatota archaeon]|jgi:8-amino-7-oxononanoate synthase|nr:aminotransferase class I/II-fold pyridoxal phosphate-dependent enzyme [Candidatus Thermoplasmatota archaeon]